MFKNKKRKPHMFGDFHKFSYFGQQQLCNDHQQLAALQPPSSPH
jgi:hypothetical protein